MIKKLLCIIAISILQFQFVNAVNLSAQSTIRAGVELKENTCFGAGNASIKVVNVTGGQAPYMYKLNESDFQSSNLFDNLNAGQFEISIKDSTGKIYIMNAFIKGPDKLDFNLSGNAPSSPSAEDGSINAIPTGGIPPFNFSVNNGDYTADRNFTNLKSGTYEVTLKDGFGCTITKSIQIGEKTTVIATPIQAKVELKENTCFGSANASIKVINVSGGTPPYKYQVNNSAYQTNNLFENLNAGQFEIRVKDSKDKVFVMNAFIKGPGKLDFTLEGTDPSTPIAKDGSLKVAPLGGIPPFTFSVNDGEYTAERDFSNLESGTYEVTLKDAFGCSKTKTIKIGKEAPALTASYKTTDNICNGASEGSITITVEGGVAPYQYQLKDGKKTTNNSFNNLAAGKYTIVITDAAKTTQTITANVQEPAKLMASFEFGHPTCTSSADGYLNVAAKGGTAPYKFQITGKEVSNSGYFADLKAGEYEITVTDGNNCSSIVQATLKATPTGSDFDGDGIVDSCDEDIDNDGVLNDKDTCDNTPKNVKVDTNGCPSLDLALDNFQIVVVPTSCGDATDGEINISSIFLHDFQIQIKDHSGAQRGSSNFNGKFSFKNLSKGSYTITVTSEVYRAFEKSFDVEIGDIEKLQVNYQLSTDKKSVKLNLKGSDTYYVIINGEKQEIKESEITLPLDKLRSDIQVHTAFDCQGIFKETIVLTNGITVFPNPVRSGEMTQIELAEFYNGKTVTYTLYSAVGSPVLSGSKQIANNIADLNLQALPTGIYTLVIEADGDIFTKKIAKK